MGAGSGVSKIAFWVFLEIFVGHTLRLPSFPSSWSSCAKCQYRLRSDFASDILPTVKSTGPQWDTVLRETLPQLFGSEEKEQSALNRSDSKGKYGLVTIAVGNPDYWQRKGREGDDFFGLLSCLKHSADRYDTTLPFHLIYGGGFNGSTLTSLRSLGYIIDDYSNMTSFFRQIHHPLFRAQEAFKQQRLFKPAVALNRHDVWATYFKFLIWTMIQYEKVLFIDADVVLYENPERLFSEKNLRKLKFQAHSETRRRRYEGVNTHLMYVEPSLDTFKTIVDRADRGLYLPYTNTEQDVLEWFFLPRLFTGIFSDKRIALRHMHGKKECNRTIT